MWEILVYVCIYIYIYIYIYTYIHTYMCIYIFIHTQVWEVPHLATVRGRSANSNVSCLRPGLTLNHGRPLHADPLAGHQAHVLAPGRAWRRYKFSLYIDLSKYREKYSIHLHVLSGRRYTFYTSISALYTDFKVVNGLGHWLLRMCVRARLCHARTRPRTLTFTLVDGLGH
jgi:hypothetical protein